MSNAIQVVFNNQTITAFMHNDTPVVALKPIVENMGLQWEAQYKRTNRHPVLSSTMSIMNMVAEDGKNREMLCLPLDMLNGWLFGIDANRVKPELKERVIAYQRECFKVLANHFGIGARQIQPAPEKPTKQVLIGGLAKEQQDAMKALVNSRIDSVPKDKQGATARKLWGAVNRKFGTKSYKEIAPENFTAALSLIARVAIEGEFIGADEKPKQIEAPTPEPVQLNLYPMMNYTIPKTDDWHDRFEAAQHGVNNLVAGLRTGNAKVIDKTFYEIRNAQLDMMRVSFCACGASVGYLTMIARYAIIGMQACSTPLLVSRI